MPPALFFFKNDLAICELLWFYINYLPVNKSHWNYDRDCIKSIDHSDSIYFNNIKSSNSWAQYFFPFVLSFLISFIDVLQFSIYRSLTSLVKFILRYFSLFNATENEIIFLIPFSGSLLLVQLIFACWFCILKLYSTFYQL